MLTLTAALLHAALLSEIAGPAPDAPRAAAMQVRTLLDAPPAREARDDIETPPPAAAVPVPVSQRQRAPVTHRPALAKPSAPVAAPTLDASPTPSADAAIVSSDAAVPSGDLLLAAATPSTAPAAPAGASAAPAAEETIPHYRTQMPGAATLRYQVSKGVLHGSGELQWRPQGDKYEITLESKIGSLKLLTQVSSGVFDADGIAPVRFTDWRVRRSTVAANFQRDAGKITFSASKGEMPLEPGVQDRVSWMVQLAAIVSAQPNLRTPGAKVIMHVVGANAESSVWAFVCMGNESVRTDLGPVNALKFVRESRGAHDTTAQAWLDPTRHYLPARASLRSGADDDAFELRLEDVIGTP